MGIRIVDINDGFTSVSSPTLVSNTWEIMPIQSIPNAGEIDLGLTDNQLLLLAGDGGAQTVSTTPFGLMDAADGTVVRLLGTDDINTIGINYNDSDYGFMLNGNIIIKNLQSITLQWNQAQKRWFEISRNI